MAFLGALQDGTMIETGLAYAGCNQVTTAYYSLLQVTPAARPAACSMSLCVRHTWRIQACVPCVGRAAMTVMPTPRIFQP